MADSEEFRLKRLKLDINTAGLTTENRRPTSRPTKTRSRVNPIIHEERMSRVFDEVMGLGEFADSSRGSATSSKSGGQDEAKEVDETLGHEEQQPIEEEDSNSSRQEEKMDEVVEDSTFPRIASSSSDQHNSFNMGSNEGGGGGSGGAAFDDALDGLPSYGQEEEEEDWHFALPMGTLEDVDVSKANRKISQPAKENSEVPGDSFAREPREEEEEEEEEQEQEQEQEREGSNASANTSHSSQDHTPENSREWEEEESKQEEQQKQRHKNVTSDELDKLEDEKEEENTKKVTKWAVTILRDFLKEKGRNTDLDLSATELNSILREFYASVQSQEGKHYSVASLMSMRAALNRFFRHFNIIADSDFQTSNAVLKSVIKRYRKSENDKSSHHPKISESDIQIITASNALSCDTPAGLVRKVWWDIQLCFAKKGREGNRQLSKSSFVLLRDDDGIEYVSLAHNPHTKNHANPNEAQKENPRGFMFAKPGDPLCPVTSFKKYVSKCPNDATAFYLHPKRIRDPQAEDIWYAKEPMGVHFLGNMLKKICEEVRLTAPLSRIYTNYSIRSTAVTGHRCETSLRSCLAPSTEDRKNGSSTTQEESTNPHRPQMKNSDKENAPVSLNKYEGVLNQTEETEDSQQGETSEAAPMEDSNPPTSPSVNIKDEPIDEGYDAALLPQSSIRQIKEELEHQEEELRISSVYSVGGGNTFAAPTMPAAIPAPTPTAIFIPGRGAVLQAMTPLPLRPPVPVPTSVSALAPIPPRPPQPPVPGSVRCSGCSKVLLKGQTAFQRKGSTQLFCSTVCLTGHLPPANKNRSCFQCNREILQPRDMITIPADDNTLMHFCGQFCLSVFRHKKKQVDKVPDKRQEKKPEKPPEKPVERQPEKPFCSVCRVTNRIEHEVNHQGRLHRLCSDACFVTWRKMRQLAMNCCEGCGLYCNSNSGSCQTLTIDRSQLNFCGPTCIGTYKQTCRKTVECANCHIIAIVSTTIMERDMKGKVQLYCSPTCVEQSRPPQHILTGTPFPCSLCKVSAVPQYHLAMVDGTIRNFCSYTCVSIYRKSGHTSPPDLTNGTSSLRDASIRDAPRAGPSAGASSVPPIPQDYPSSVPYPGHHPSHTSVPPLVTPYQAMSSPSVPGQAQAKPPPGQPQKPADCELGDISKLTCHQCSKQFNSKPLLFSHQGRISVFCSKTCCEQYKTQKNILALCEYCKQPKVLFETINYNQQDVIFCSENCKALFKQDLTFRNKDHPWHPCTYCSGISQKMLHSHYGGKMEEFCKPHCMSQYTVLYYGMGRCDSCRKQGYMSEKLQCLGSVRNFCNLPCLLQYCYLHFETNQHSSSNGTGTAPQTPYAPTQPHHSSKMNPVIADVVSLANGSATQPSGSADTALTGALPTSNVDGKHLDHASTQTDAMRVPASRRRQMKNKSVLCRPFTMDQEITCQMPTPSTESGAGEEKVKVRLVTIPVPVFIPVPMNMYSQHTPVPVAMPIPFPVPIVVLPQSKEMKDAAVQSETFAVTDEKQRDECVPSADLRSSHSGHVMSESVAPTICDDETEKAIQADVPSYCSADLQITTQPETSKTISDPPTASTVDQPPSSPMMDLESDFPSESLGQKSPARKRGVKRSRDGSSSRKRSRRRTGSAEQGAVVNAAASKLNHLYGVKAWRFWVQQRNQHPQEPSTVDVKEDILECNSAELNFALSRFVKEVRRPNGEAYSPDSIFYLCLGIQQYLFIKGRIENIFTDKLYCQFATEITEMLRLWKPKLLPSGHAVSSRVEESYLWECKQLGAYSPIVLLNTLLFFCTKNFRFTTLEQHQFLSFSNLIRHTKSSSRTSKVLYLQFQRSSTATPNQEETEQVRKRQAENEGDLEMIENVTNPLQCPVRLYEFYLSRCPESVKKTANFFYLQPEQNVNTHSSHWFTSQPLDSTTLQSMLTRILAVREVQQQGAAQPQSSAAPEADGLQ
ncbi:zinc finger MYM-type protein 4-like [Stegastes partitus]|uniref:Zinc finger MYM-type protein 4-like n=1 Tax=Stegastes partitus TaxID=144197 RepID=A0A9Y4U0G0_9TELE|nr:PREDICTED: zinc finger MYM-type protein 4-like [Stegastes partitus]